MEEVRGQLRQAWSRLKAFRSEPALGTCVDDMIGIAVHPKTEILSQIIDPNRSVEGTYRVYTAIAKDGTVVNGLLLSESRTALVPKRRP